MHSGTKPPDSRIEIKIRVFDFLLYPTYSGDFWVDSVRFADNTSCFRRPTDDELLRYSFEFGGGQGRSRKIVSNIHAPVFVSSLGGTFPRPLGLPVYERDRENMFFQRLIVSNGFYMRRNKLAVMRTTEKSEFTPFDRSNAPYLRSHLRDFFKVYKEMPLVGWDGRELAIQRPGKLYFFKIIDREYNKPEWPNKAYRLTDFAEENEWAQLKELRKKKAEMSALKRLACDYSLLSQPTVPKPADHASIYAVLQNRCKLAHLFDVEMNAETVYVESEPVTEEVDHRAALVDVPSQETLQAYLEIDAGRDLTPEEVASATEEAHRRRSGVAQPVERVQTAYEAPASIPTTEDKDAFIVHDAVVHMDYSDVRRKEDTDSGVKPAFTANARVTVTQDRDAFLVHKAAVQMDYSDVRSRADSRILSITPVDDVVTLACNCSLSVAAPTSAVSISDLPIVSSFESVSYKSVTSDIQSLLIQPINGRVHPQRRVKLTPYGRKISASRLLPPRQRFKIMKRRTSWPNPNFVTVTPDPSESSPVVVTERPVAISPTPAVRTDIVSPSAMSQAVSGRTQTVFPTLYAGTEHGEINNDVDSSTASEASSFNDYNPHEDLFAAKPKSRTARTAPEASNITPESPPSETLIEVRVMTPVEYARHLYIGSRLQNSFLEVCSRASLAVKILWSGNAAQQQPIGEDV